MQARPSLRFALLPFNTRKSRGLYRTVYLTGILQFFIIVRISFHIRARQRARARFHADCAQPDLFRGSVPSTATDVIHDLGRIVRDDVKRAERLTAHRSNVHRQLWRTL